MLSRILFQAGQPLGTMRARTDAGCVAVPVRVVKPVSSRLRSLAKLALFAHRLPVTTPTTCRVARFRGDLVEHRETFNIARRIGDA